MAERFKSTAQNLLRRLGLYQRIKFSFFYDLYWRMADPKLLTARDDEVEFFRNVLIGLKTGDLVFDVGANRGHKTDIFLRLGARVIAIDPDPSNQEILRQNFLHHRISTKPVTVVNKAVSDRRGRDTMWVDAPGSAKNTLSPKWVEILRGDAKRFGDTLKFGQQLEVESVTLEDLIAQYGRPFYIKIDVEGHEPSVLRGLNSSVPFISFEVNLPEFAPEARECVELLDALSPDRGFNYMVDCQAGMALPEWPAKSAFLDMLDSCTEPSVEIFWRGGTPDMRRRIAAIS